MAYNYSTTSCMPPPISPIPSYDQASSHDNAGRTPDPCNTAPVNGNSHYYMSEPATSPHWVSPTPSLGNPFSFDSAFSHSSYVSGYASPVSPNTHRIAALSYPIEQQIEAGHGTSMRSNERDNTRAVYDMANEDVSDYKSNVHVKREYGANAKALMLLQETVGVDVTCTVAPVAFGAYNHDEKLDYDVMSEPGQYQKTSSITANDNNPPSKDDSNDAKCFKTGFDVVRERGANLKALALLEQTVGYDISDAAKATSIYLHKPTLTVAEESYHVRQQLKAEYKAKKRAEKEFEEQKMLKDEELFEAKNSVSNGRAVLSEEETSSKHIRAKMVAEFKAKKKLEKYAGGARALSPEPTCTETSTSECPTSPLTIIAEKPIVETEIKTNGQSHSVAVVPDEELSSKQIRAKIIAEYKAKKKLDKTVGYKMVEKETLAESSRIPTKCDNDYDTETIAGMKCEIDIERENIARKKALQLLNDRPGLMA